MIERVVFFLPISKGLKARIGFHFFKKACNNARRAAIIFHGADCPMASHLASSMLEKGISGNTPQEMSHDICYN